MYKLVYMPAAKQDIIDTVKYITENLHNAQAAKKLALDLKKAIDILQDFPYTHPEYRPLKALKHSYRKIPVNNYLVFYWIDEQNQNVNIARIIYAKRNYNLLLR